MLASIDSHILLMILLTSYASILNILYSIFLLFSVGVG